MNYEICFPFFTPYPELQKETLREHKEKSDKLWRQGNV